MKRVIGFVLSAVMLVSALGLCCMPVSAASDMKTSDDLIKILKQEEGFVRYPVWDYSQWTVGYGTRCPSDMLDYYRANGIQESEAELLLRNHLTNTERMINQRIVDRNQLEITQGQFDAMVSFSYNMGASWTNDTESNIYKQIVEGAVGNDLINAFTRWCNAGGSVQHYLVRRRLCEANMYLNGQYSRNAPDNFCYVTYNGNGGSVDYSAQGYDGDLTAQPNVTATHSKYTFSGWYTAQVGGTKVEVLDKSISGRMLYAHWSELNVEEPEENVQPVTVTVNIDDVVNLRKGPGTNHAIIGQARKGQQFEIVQIVGDTQYIWGRYDGGWICLLYTDYDGQEIPPTDPETTEPDVTEPEETQPEETEADTTVPEETEPETTVPEVTEPEVTEPDTTQPAAIAGWVNADPYLCVREGPGTGYKTVDTLQNGEKVLILEQKSAGSMMWGKISNGWVSMSYVKLEQSGQTPEQGQKGTVQCALLNVRTGAGIGYGIAGYYYQGNTVTVTEQKTVGNTVWGKTEKGWVSMDYVKLTDASGPSEPAPEQPDNTDIVGTVVSDDVLRIRAGAGTSYAIKGFLNPGDTVTVTEQKTIGATVWGKIDKGWICMDYIETQSKQPEDSGNNEESTQQPENPDTDEPEQEQIRTVTCSCLIIRNGAGTAYDIVDYLYQGAKVTVTQTKQVDSMIWGKIANGWICLDYTK